MPVVVKARTFSTGDKNRTLIGAFTVHKFYVEPNMKTHHGGVHGQYAYDLVAEAEVPVTLHETGKNVVEGGANGAVTVLVSGTKYGYSASITNFELVTLSDTQEHIFEPDVNRYGVVLDGTCVTNAGGVEDPTYVANTGVYILIPGEKVTAQGPCKLITFLYQQD